MSELLQENIATFLLSVECVFQSYEGNIKQYIETYAVGL
jgi:hypothetical protein